MMNYFVDTHSHLYKEYYPEEFSGYITRAINENVKKIILPCVTYKSITQIFDSVDQYPCNLFPLVGLHPTEVKKETYMQELENLKKHITNSRIAGIGECGIDLYWDKTTLEEQKKAFIYQLEWAVEYQLPLSLHIRDAYSEAIEILKLYTKKNIKAVLHCFSGGIEEAKWATKHNFMLGIGGVITFKNNKLQDIVREVGLNNIVLETDAPFLAPVPYRGRQNESSYIPLIAQKIADIFDTDIDEIMNTTTDNALKIFNI